MLLRLLQSLQELRDGSLGTRQGMGFSNSLQRESSQTCAFVDQSAHNPKPSDVQSCILLLGRPSLKRHQRQQE